MAFLDPQSRATVLVVDDVADQPSLMAVADVYDALISRRVYKQGMPHTKAWTLISEGRGRHFDPDIADAFLALHEQFRAIAAELADTDADMALKLEQLRPLGGTR